LKKLIVAHGGRENPRKSEHVPGRVENAVRKEPWSARRLHHQKAKESRCTERKRELTCGKTKGIHTKVRLRSHSNQAKMKRKAALAKLSLGTKN